MALDLASYVYPELHKCPFNPDVMHQISCCYTCPKCGLNICIHTYGEHKKACVAPKNREESL